MTGLDRVRERLAAFLTERGVSAVTAWPAAPRKRLEGPVAAVSLRRCEGGPAGFRDYLGERYDPDSGRWEELYGKRVRLVFGLDLYGSGGGDELDAAFDALAEALSGPGPEGLRFVELSGGETAWDGQSGLWRRGAEAVCEAILYAVAEEGGAFLDFEVRGDRQ